MEHRLPRRRDQRVARRRLPVRDEDVARLSLYVRRHLNVDGHYLFALPDLAGARRALRDPDSPDEDD